jgi:hypothetical protein
MDFNEWRLWFKKLPWTLSWFIVLVLLRPVIDSFYYLKETSLFISPLYIVGVATPILCLIAIIKIPKPNYSRLDTAMSIYSGLIFLSCFFLLIKDFFSLKAIEFSLKLSIPVFLYFFCRRLIRSKKDLIGVFVAFLYSSVFVIITLAYELIFNPINVQMSRGLVRIQGNFADVSNYAIYASCLVLIAGFIYFENTKKRSFQSRMIIYFVMVLVSLLIVINIHHTVSYVVILSLLALFILNNFRTNFGSAIFFLLTAVIITYTVGKEAVDANIIPLIETDILVYEGEKESEALLHGRVGRWQIYLTKFNESSVVAQLIGLPVNIEKPYKYISSGSHNDYLRILLFTGYLGLATYITILISLYFRSIKHKPSMRYTGIGTLAILVLYSVSTTPSLYAPLLYVVIPIMAMLALPRKMMG